MRSKTDSETAQGRAVLHKPERARLARAVDVLVEYSWKETRGDLKQRAEVAVARIREILVITGEESPER